MDHRYIDDHSLADRYLDRALPPHESGQFEAHLVDCQECRDRLLLAEMFHARNGASKPSQAPPLEYGPPDAPDSLRIRLSAQFAISRIISIFAAAAAAATLLLLASAAFFAWVLRLR